MYYEKNTGVFHLKFGIILLITTFPRPEAEKFIPPPLLHIRDGVGEILAQGLWQEGSGQDAGEADGGKHAVHDLRVSATLRVDKWDIFLQLIYWCSRLYSVGHEFCVTEMDIMG